MTVSIKQAAAIATALLLAVPQSMIAQNASTRLHRTTATKEVVVKDLAHLKICTFSGGYFTVIPSDGKAMIFDREYNECGTLENCLQTNIIFDGSSRALACIRRDEVKYDLVNYDLVIINPHGQIEKTVFKNSHMSSFRFQDGIGSYFSEATGDVFFDINGKTVYSCKDRLNHDAYNGLTPVNPLVDGRRRIIFGDGTAAYLDGNCKMALKASWNYISDFSEGLAVARRKEGDLITYGYIDTEGNWAIEPVFTNRPSDFHEGYAVAKRTDGTYCYIDRTGSAVSDSYTHACPFMDGYAIVCPVNADASVIEVEGYSDDDPRVKFEKLAGRTREYSVVDRNFNEVGRTDCHQRKYHRCNGDGVICDGYYVYDAKGRLLLKTDYEIQGISENCIGIVKYKEGKTLYRGYADLKTGEMLLLFRNSEF